MGFLLDKIASLRRRQSINVMLCGLRGSGKTTLLYKSLIKGWDNICNEIEPTILYHYEELNFGGVKYGIWDISGDKKISYIPGYIAKQVQVTAVVFVVNVMDESDTSRNEIIDRIHKMKSDYAFERSLFIILFNRMSNDEHVVTSLEGTIKEPLAPYEHTAFFSCNALKGVDDPGWLNALKLIQSHHRTLE